MKRYTEEDHQIRMADLEIGSLEDDIVIFRLIHWAQEWQANRNKEEYQAARLETEKYQAELLKRLSAPSLYPFGKHGTDTSRFSCSDPAIAHPPHSGLTPGD